MPSMSQTCSIGIRCRKALKSTRLFERIGATSLFEGTDQCYSISTHCIAAGARPISKFDPEAAEVPRPVLGDGRKRGGTVAIGKKAAPAKEAEKRRPDFVVRAKVKDDVWVTIGAAWS